MKAGSLLSAAIRAVVFPVLIAFPSRTTLLIFCSPPESGTTRFAMRRTSLPSLYPRFVPEAAPWRRHRARCLRTVPRFECVSNSPIPVAWFAGRICNASCKEASIGCKRLQAFVSLSARRPPRHAGRHACARATNPCGRCPPLNCKGLPWFALLPLSNLGALFGCLWLLWRRR